jgi:hypothetical protein
MNDERQNRSSFVALVGESIFYRVPLIVLAGDFFFFRVSL